MNEALFIIAGSALFWAGLLGYVFWDEWTEHRYTSGERTGRKMKRRRLSAWCRVLLALLCLALSGVAVVQVRFLPRSEERTGAK